MRDDKLWTRFPLTRQSCEVDEDDEDEQPQGEHRLLRAMADESGGAMTSPEPGVWVVAKLEWPSAGA